MKYIVLILLLTSIISCSKTVECSCLHTTTEDGVIIENYSYQTEYKESDYSVCKSHGFTDTVNGIWVVNSDNCRIIN